MNDRTKFLTKKKEKALFQKQIESNTFDHAILTDITLELSNAINFSKAKYHQRLAVQLNDPKASKKIYWSNSKTFVNESNITLIPPILVNNEHATDFLDKANLFNDSFREHCKPITNGSFLPDNQIFGTVIRLSDVNFILLLVSFVHGIQRNFTAAMESQNAF